MRSTKTKLTIRLIEVEGSADTIERVITSLGDIGGLTENGDSHNVRVRHVRKTKPESELPKV